MKFLNGFTVLLLFQLVGETTVHLLHLSIPGSVLGMVLLFVALLLRRRVAKSLDTASTGLLSHLSLLFVPAGVGVMAQFNRIANEWVSISIALVMSTLITLAATAAIMQASQRLFRKQVIS
ncbi:MAG: CidA/LrgA family protein [Cyanobacteria bacterium J06598_1]